MAQEPDTIQYDTQKSYVSLIEMMTECSSYLDRKYGYVLGGSPTAWDNIKAHYAVDLDREYAKFGMILVAAFGELQNNTEAHMEKFMKINH